MNPTPELQTKAIMFRRPGYVSVPISPTSPLPAGRDAINLLATSAAISAVILMGLRLNIGLGLTPGYLLAFILIPLWLSAANQFRGATLILLTSCAAVVSGLWLAANSSVDHEVISKNLVADSLTVLGAAASVGMLLWMRQMLPVHLIGLFCGVGLLATIFVSELRTTTNPWKYAFSVPIVVIALSLVGYLANRLAEIVVLLVLGVISALNDSRSFFAILALTAILLVWQYFPASRRHAVYKTILALAATAIATYTTASYLAVDGYLGAEAQTRSLQQIETSGSLLIGGRPELTAFLASFRNQPFGFGAGVVASPAEILVAKEGMKGINYDPNNGYVERYMFGEKIELHSVLGDLWAYFGLPGLIAGIAVVVLLVGLLITMVAHRNGSGIKIFLITLTLWNFLFSPLYSSVPTLLLTLGLTLLRKHSRREKPELSHAQSDSLSRTEWKSI